MDANLKALLQSGANITIAISLSDLREVYKEIIENTKKELDGAIKKENNETYLTQKQVIEMTGFSRSTLNRWHKAKYLLAIETGGGLRYRLSDIKSLMSGGRRDA